MKNYIINLERATERRELVIEEFAYHGIDFEIVPGVDWLDLTECDVREIVDPKFLAKSKNWPDPMCLHGMLACWLSHRKVWQKALSEGERRIAVFEDDVNLTDDAKSALKAIYKLDNIEFDIVFLYDSYREKQMIPVHKIDDKFALNLVKFTSMGAVSYIINNHAMKALLDQYPLMNMAIDQLMHWYWVTGMRTYILTPQTAFHGDTNPYDSHHSYSGESGIYNDTLEWKKANSFKFKMYKLKVEMKNLRTFPLRLFSKYIPQRLAFYRRIRSERNSVI